MIMFLNHVFIFYNLHSDFHKLIFISKSILCHYSSLYKCIYKALLTFYLSLLLSTLQLPSINFLSFHWIFHLYNLHCIYQLFISSFHHNYQPLFSLFLNGNHDKLNYLKFSIFLYEIKLNPIIIIVEVINWSLLSFKVGNQQSLQISFLISQSNHLIWNYFKTFYLVFQQLFYYLDVYLTFYLSIYQFWSLYSFYYCLKPL